MTGRRRVRREIRTLSETQRQAYFAALRTMRTTSMAAGQRRFGAAYRSHAYMLLKHATSALHPCVDQGHDIENQMTFHRALLLEVEASVLAIVSTLEPNVTLGALPYWDFATDIAQTGNWWSGSLWKYWGSPFGDPDNDYCIEDPVFESKVERGMVPELQPLMNEIFGMDAESDGDFVMGNGHGWWRSPWNQAQCPGLARNPGWVLGAPTAIGSTFRDCQGASNYTVFMMCVQGRGFTRQGPDIGPHNAPHVSMGTFYDEGVGDAVFVTMLAFLSLGTFASACMSVLCFGKLRAEAKGTEMHWPSRWSWMLSVLLSLSIIGCFAAPAVHEAVVGVSGASLHVRWLRETFKRQSIDFKGTEWRSGALQCPASGTCVEGERCACSLNRYECGFVGADFWDGAFSLNENYFYSIHAFTDLLHLRWAAQRSEAPILANNFGGFPLVGRCPGMALEDDISEEFCFSSNDIGVSNLTGSGDASTPAHSANPKEPCLTHADILALNSPSLHDDRALLPYTYDVLVADAVWRPIEPTLECTKEIACDRSGNERNASLLRDVRAHGDFVCMPSAEIFSTNSSEDLRHRSPADCNVPKPHDPPLRVCSCKAEIFRARTLELREKLREQKPKRVSLAQDVGSGALFLALFIMFATLAHRCWKRRQIQYVLLDDGAAAVIELGERENHQVMTACVEKENEQGKATYVLTASDDRKENLAES